MSDISQLTPVLWSMLRDSRLAYYGSIVQGFRISYDSTCPTAGVGFSKDGTHIHLVINPDWFSSLSRSEQIGVLIHEVRHVDGLHILRCSELAEPLRANLAADLTINPEIGDIYSGSSDQTVALPAGCMLPKDFGFSDGWTLDVYYEKLPESKKYQDMMKQGQSGNFDDHSKWQDAGNLPKEIKEALVESTIKDAVSKSFGKVPGHVQTSLDALNNMRVKNWTKELKKFVGRHVNSDEFERTWSRRNRRYGLYEAGRRFGDGKRVVIGLDTSGSMPDEVLIKAHTETLAMLKKGIVGHTIQFDCEIQSIAPLRKRLTLDIKGRGGTAFEPLFKEAVKYRADVLIIFTDGDASLPPNPGIPILWVLTNGERPHITYGHKTQLEV